MKTIRLFSAYVRPEDVFEHPPDLPTVASDIPLGPLEEWECYATRCGAPTVIGPFTPVIGRPGYQEFAKMRSIEVPGDLPFHFGMYPGGPDAVDRPAWYQSGVTLRFVRKPYRERNPS